MLALTTPLYLAVMYENELLDNRYALKGDGSEAMRWLLAAAEQGLARAQMKLVEIYDRDADMLDSSVKACEWYLLPARGLRGEHLRKARSAHRRVANLDAGSSCRGFAICPRLEGDDNAKHDERSYDRGGRRL